MEITTTLRRLIEATTVLLLLTWAADLAGVTLAAHAPGKDVPLLHTSAQGIGTRQSTPAKGPSR